MGCLKLHIESEPILRLAYSKKEQKPSKKVGWYYPFGLKHKGYNNVVSSNGNSVAQRFGFTGKEHQDELGLGWIDITARNYDAALGRWMNLDPLAEQMRRHSPYNYAFDSPIYFIDPDGMMPHGNQNGDPGDPQKKKAKGFFGGIAQAFSSGWNNLKSGVSGLVDDFNNGLEAVLNNFEPGSLYWDQQ